VHHELLVVGCCGWGAGCAGAAGAGWDTWIEVPADGGTGACSTTTGWLLLITSSDVGPRLPEAARSFATVDVWLGAAVESAVPSSIALPRPRVPSTDKLVATAAAPTRRGFIDQLP
jgi:hypothetical protein